MSCLGGKCNNVTNPVAVANPMQAAVQRRPTGIRRQGANNTTTTYNPLRRPANLTMANLEASQAQQGVEFNAAMANLEASQAQQGVEFNAAMARAFPAMPDQQNINAEWEEPSAGQTRDERKAELAEIERRRQKAITWHNSPVATPRGTKLKPAKQAAAAAFNIGNQPDINEARRDLPAGWYADYDKNGRILYYYQPTPRSAVTKEQYERPT